MLLGLGVVVDLEKFLECSGQTFRYTHDNIQKIELMSIQEPTQDLFPS